MESFSDIISFPANSAPPWRCVHYSVWNPSVDAHKNIPFFLQVTVTMSSQAIFFFPSCAWCFLRPALPTCPLLFLKLSYYFPSFLFHCSSLNIIAISLVLPPPLLSGSRIPEPWPFSLLTQHTMTFQFKCASLFSVRQQNKEKLSLSIPESPEVSFMSEQGMCSIILPPPPFPSLLTLQRSPFPSYFKGLTWL